MSEATAIPEALRPTYDPFGALARHRHLLWRFIINDALGRYRGSMLGLCWSFLNPLLLLAVFTIAFGKLFGGSAWYPDLPVKPIVLPIFSGMVVFGIFSEVLTRSPSVILSQPNFVKKVVFPLEILPVSVLGSALTHACIGLAMLILGQMALGEGFHVAALLTPLVLLPLVAFSLGIAWFLASLGVFVRDIGHSVGIVSQVFFFLTPIVYPFARTLDGSAIGDALAWSPITIVVESARRLIVWGVQPDWLLLAGMTAAGLAIAWLGFAWFQKTRGGFADVL